MKRPTHFLTGTGSPSLRLLQRAVHRHPPLVRVARQVQEATLARLCRAYNSECVAVINGDLYCREINIVGDGVWCVVNTPRKTDVDDVCSTAASRNSMIETLNYKLGKRGIDAIRRHRHGPRASADDQGRILRGSTDVNSLRMLPELVAGVEVEVGARGSPPSGRLNSLVAALAGFP